MSVTVHLLENFYRDPLDPSEARIACGQEQGAEDWNADPAFVTCENCLELIEQDREDAEEQRANESLGAKR